MKYLVANWKSHKTIKQALAWVDAFENTTLDHDIRVIVAPAFPFIHFVHSRLEEKKVPFDVASQDISPFPQGAYTGAVATEMIEKWVRYGIVGHSERRKYFHETNQDVANKVTQLLDLGITPIVCIDVPYAEQQIAALEEVSFPRLIFAYEPVEAIGSGTPDSPDHAKEIISAVKGKVGELTPVLYGGSVTAENAPGFLETGVVDGFLVGGTSLDAEKWRDLINACS